MNISSYAAQIRLSFLNHYLQPPTSILVSPHSNNQTPPISDPQFTLFQFLDFFPPSTTPFFVRLSPKINLLAETLHKTPSYALAASSSAHRRAPSEASRDHRSFSIRPRTKGKVWVRAFLVSEKNVWFEADSDSVLTKGLAALLVHGLSGRSVWETLQVSPDFVTLLGLQQSLTPSRNNGFLNMLKLMQKKALILAMVAEKLVKQEPVPSNTELGIENLNPGGNTTWENGSSHCGMKIGYGGGTPDNGLGCKVGGGDLNLGGGLANRGEKIRERLERGLKPTQLEVEDTSYQYARHAGARGSNDGETHFNLKVVLEEFEGKSLLSGTG
ncbi:hypothetical protein Nepgr_016326 [Nepenthes gracilis]|uniref:Fe-S metabolism associated domain-containing protein n=1 Tax=Nepenthes gracilis TaxID=150966 RepID=A0AAD3SPK5_NEPGR|nr:hypothetical protein Nepgr_016326 [Nepenthes gracilis]